MHQIITEMALILRQHMSQILGNFLELTKRISRVFLYAGSKLKMNIKALPSWRQKEGAHTEILLYETDHKDGQHNDASSVSKESSSKKTQAKTCCFSSLSTFSLQLFRFIESQTRYRC